jgi:hypothetical protein
MAAIPPFGPAPPVGHDFTVYTQNMQGGCNVGYASGAIRSHDVTLLQEVGRPGFLSRANPPMAPSATSPNVFTGIVRFGTTRHPDDRFVVYHDTGDRCSQAVLINTDICTGTGIFIPPEPFTIPGPVAGLRPIVGATVDGTSFGGFHAPSGNHAAAEGVLRHQLAAASAGHPNFVFGGDANSDIANQAIPGSVRAFVSPVPTHQGGGNLDGMVCSVSGNGSQLTPIMNSSSDHIIGLSGHFHI